jgi:hypothetical protein
MRAAPPLRRGKRPRHRAHACHPVPINLTELGPDSLMRIKLRRDVLRKARSARGHVPLEPRQPLLAIFANAVF